MLTRLYEQYGGKQVVVSIYPPAPVPGHDQWWYDAQNNKLMVLQPIKAGNVTIWRWKEAQ